MREVSEQIDRGSSCWDEGQDAKRARLDRDYAAGAPEAEAAGEIIYE